MTTNKKLKDIIGEDEYQMCLDLGRRIIRCPICENETFNDWFICPHCNWEAEPLHSEDEYSPANKSTIAEYRKKYMSENHFIDDGVTFSNDVNDGTFLIDDINNFEIENGAFGGFSKEIRIPCGVRKIAPLALAPLERMKKLVLPKTIECFEPSALRQSYDTSTKQYHDIWGVINSRPQSLEEIHICKENPHYQSKNGILYSADGTRLIYLPPSHHRKTVEIAEGVYELCEDSCCFADAKEIMFPSTLRRISDRACCSSNLKNTQIPSCELGESAFQGSILPEYADIYNEVIPAKAFANCAIVKGIFLHYSVKLVKNGAFSYTDIEKIYIPPTTQIEENAFVREERRWSGEEYEYHMENYKKMIIGGERGSNAEIFANANGIKFEVVGNSEEEIKIWLSWKERNEDLGDFGTLCF